MEQSRYFDMIVGTVTLVLVVAAALYTLYRLLKRSEDPAALIVKWILTAVVVWIMFFKVGPMIWRDAFGAFLGMHLVALCGLGLAAIWQRSLANLLAKPFQGLYDGGSREVDPEPVYSVTQARRKRGLYREALAEVRRQLEGFPNDYTGQMLMAEILAEDLNDLQGAEVVIQRLCGQAGHSPGRIAMAWNTLADWHLKYQLDVDAARQDLERIIERFPGTELASLAEQRIGHLGSADYLLSRHDPKPVPVPAGIPNLGLRPPEEQRTALSQTPEEEVEQCVRQLELHPMDTESRERLAVLYADHYGRLDLASEQLEQMIEHPTQPMKRVVHWLDLLADLQVRHGADYETVRGTVRRIVERYPDSPAAQTALNRLDRLKLEIKGRSATPTIPLGNYEQDIGLKGRLPNQL